MIITEDLAIKVAEIEGLLTEAYEHYFKFSDGYCKSSEGAITISIPPYFWREEGPVVPAVEVWSYVLGPSRSHWFDNVDKALAAVREWHAAEMAHDHSDEGWGE